MQIFLIYNMLTECHFFTRSLVICYLIFRVKNNLVYITEFTAHNLQSAYYL